MQTSTATNRSRAPRLTATSRAVRAALLASGAALALAGSGIATAGTCTTTLDVIACNGVFDTPGTDPALDFVGDDLTVVLGLEEPTSVVADGVDGISLESAAGNATAINYADILSTGGGYANAIEVIAYGDVLVQNAGSAIASASIETGYLAVEAIVATGYNATVDNSGIVAAEVSVELGNVLAVGVEVAGDLFSTLYNDEGGSISASAESGAGVYYGPDANSFGAFVVGTSVLISNSGEISASSSVQGGPALSAATGSMAYAIYGFATTVNYGDIGAFAESTSVEASYAFAYGSVTKAYPGAYAASTVNAGDIHAQAEVYVGAAISYGSRSIAKYSSTQNYAGANISAVSIVEHSGLASAVGSQTYGIYYAHAVNDGNITAYALAHHNPGTERFTYGSAGATGVIVDSRYFGGAVMENNGPITAVALTPEAAGFFYGGAGATGVYENGKYYAGLTNHGDIGAYAGTELGIAVAYGVMQRSKYGAETYVYNGDDSDIVAIARAGSAADDTYGGRAIASGTKMFGGSWAVVYNEGLIAAHAYVDPNDREYFDNPAIAMAYGTYQRGIYGATLRNGGDILADAEADFGMASAYGAHVEGGYYAVTYNDGLIQAVAKADYGDAFAVGNYTASVGQRYYEGCGPYGCYYSYSGGLAYAYNTGEILAHAGADGGIATAYGQVLIGREYAGASNSGDIHAVAVADDGIASAVGQLLRSDYGAVSLTMYEGATLVAAAYGADASATALLLLSPDLASVVNSGSIVALGDGERIAIDARYAATSTIYNDGLIAGSILTGDGDDLLVNASGGTIRLDGALVDLGADAGGGNTFDNFGSISLEGTNSIHMGHGSQTAVPSLNPNAFYNGGQLDFQDGDTDDVLTITGDFAGDGDINVDVSGLNGASDLLYIDGSVESGTTGVINVDLLDLSEGIASLIPIVSVSGNSVAGNFVVGDVHWDEDNSFVSLGFDIVSDIDATNATPDVFALDVEVTGLSDPGTLAASIVPGVHNLMNTQVGSWRQRMGVIDGFSKGAITLWARVFNSKGSFSPEHVAANFGDGGNFDWNQKSSGAEAGIDFSVTDEFSLGLLLASSKSDLDLEGPGAGAAELDGETWGVYGTWISPNGFYLDASYRWMSFDVDLNSVAGASETKGDAESFNLELGYTWTLADGLKIEPQLQYTRTSIDGVDVLTTTTGMSFRNDAGDSSRGRAGLAIRKGFGEADTGWQWTPYASLSAVREFDGENAYAINDTFLGASSIEGTSALVELGFTARHQNLSIHGGLNWQDGGAVNSVLGGQLSVRYTFGGAR